jgi:glycosyltransferase involved in cell wall biosynthesis
MNSSSDANSGPKQKDPLVSVVITAYNVADYIAEAINSALAQTYGNQEIIVVDDGSEDRTADICQSYGNRIIYHRQQNSGVAHARNEGVRLARGELVAMLDGDDYWLPDKMAKQMEALERHAEADFMCTNYVHLLEGGRISEAFFDQNEYFRELSNRQKGDTIIVERKDFAQYIRSPFGHLSNAVFRRELFLELGGYDGRFIPIEDSHFWFRYLAKCRSLLAIRIPLSVYRIRQGSAVRKPSSRSNEMATTVYEHLLSTLRSDHPDLAGALRYRVRTARLHWVHGLLRQEHRQDAFRVGVKALSFGWDWRIAKVLAGIAVGR